MSLRVFGHICRLPNSAPAKKALYEGLRQSKRRRGGQRLTLLKQLAEMNIDIYRAIRLAQDIKAWRIMIVMWIVKILWLNTYGYYRQSIILDTSFILYEGSHLDVQTSSAAAYISFNLLCQWLYILPWLQTYNPHRCLTCTPWTYRIIC